MELAAYLLAIVALSMAVSAHRRISNLEKRRAPRSDMSGYWIGEGKPTKPNDIEIRGY